MNVAHHRMPREMFQALARGGGGLHAVRELAAAQHSKHLLLLSAVAGAARSRDDRQGMRGYELLAEVQRQDPAAAEEVIRHPSVGAWAVRTLRAQAPPAAEPAGLAAVGAAAAIRAGVPAEIEVPVTDGLVVLPSLGAAAANGQAAIVRTSPAEVSSPGLRVAVNEGGRHWLGLRRVRAGSFDVLIDDFDPFRMPTQRNLTARLTSAEVGELSAMLGDVWLVLDPAVAAEVAAAVRVIVPCHAPPGGYVSVTAPENFGAVAMSRQSDHYTCAATLVHEVQHLKLSALLDLVVLTLPDDGHRYYAPWRADPRPVSSLLQGAYAFLGVTGFWRWQRLAPGDSPAGRQRADAEFARWRMGTARVVRTLQSSGRLTTQGREFVGEMAQVIAGWEKDPVPADVLALIQREAAEHLTRWQADNNGFAP